MSGLSQLEGRGQFLAGTGVVDLGCGLDQGIRGAVPLECGHRRRRQVLAPPEKELAERGIEAQVLGLRNGAERKEKSIAQAYNALSDALARVLFAEVCRNGKEAPIGKV